MKWGSQIPYDTGLRRSLFDAVPRGLEPPMDTYLHSCRREVNQNPVTKSGLKHFPGGACPQALLAFADT